MGRPQVSFAKRQREQAKRERKQLKAEKRAQRTKDGSGAGPEIDTQVVAEGVLDDELPEEFNPTA